MPGCMITTARACGNNKYAGIFLFLSTGCGITVLLMAGGHATRVQLPAARKNYAGLV